MPIRMIALLLPAVQQAREAAATQGFFSADVDIKVDRSTKPVAVTLTITPGAPTHIASVAIDVTGPADTLPEGQEAIRKLRDEWLLPKGAQFRQQTWTAAKQRATATLAASPFAAATMTASEAKVDPAAYRADLSVTLASGPPFRIGTIDVQGLKRYTPELVMNFGAVPEGSLYSEQAMDDYVRRLLASGYFASVQASIDTNVEPPQVINANIGIAGCSTPVGNWLITELILALISVIARLPS